MYRADWADGALPSRGCGLAAGEENGKTLLQFKSLTEDCLMQLYALSCCSTRTAAADFFQFTTLAMSCLNCREKLKSNKTRQ